VALFFQQGLRRGVPENVETLSIGLHQAILDAIVDHLDETADAAGTTMDVAELYAGIAVFALGGPRDVTSPWRQRLEDRVQVIDSLFVAAAHQAVAALETPERRRSCRSSTWRMPFVFRA